MAASLKEALRHVGMAHYGLGRSPHPRTDGRELLVQEADVFIPAAIPNVIDATVAPRLRVRLVAEGTNNAVAPQVARYARRRGR